MCQVKIALLVCWHQWQVGWLFSSNRSCTTHDIFMPCLLVILCLHGFVKYQYRSPNQIAFLQYLVLYVNQMKNQFHLTTKGTEQVDNDEDRSEVSILGPLFCCIIYCLVYWWKASCYIRVEKRPLFFIGVLSSFFQASSGRYHDLSYVIASSSIITVGIIIIGISTTFLY